MKRFNDGVVQSRVDKRYLATAYNYLQSKGIHSRTVSELIRGVLEEFVEILCANELAVFIETSEEARSILAIVYGHEALNPGRRGLKNEYSNLNIDSVIVAPKLVENDPKLAKMVARALEVDKDLHDDSPVDTSNEEVEAVLGKTSEKFEGPGGQIHEEPEGWKVDEAKRLLKKRDKKKDSDIPRQKSSAELDADDERRRKKDEAYEKKLKEM